MRMFLIVSMFLSMNVKLVAMSCSMWSGGIHVAPCGDDANPGTKNKPLKTIVGARNFIRNLRKTDASKKNQAVTVFLANGNYFSKGIISFDERDSNTTYRAYGKNYQSGMPTIYGGIKVQGWSKWKKGIWRAKSPTKHVFRRLFIDGKSGILARHPNKGDGYGGGLRKYNNVIIGIPKAWKDYNFTHAQVYGWLGADWFTEMRSVQSVDRKNLRLRVSRGSGQFKGLNGRVYIQGVPELLDEPGEWALNSKDGYIYYWPKHGENPNKMLVVAPISESVLDIRGSSMNKRVESMTFEGLHFVGSDFSRDWWLFDRRKVREADTPKSLQKGLICIENAKRIAIRHSKIIGAGHSGVFIKNWAQECEVYGCWIEDAGFAGVYMNGFAPGRGPFKKVEASYVNKKHRIVNNFIYDCGQFVGAGCGIQFYQSGDNEVSHNRIAKMPRYGISYKGIRYGVLGHTLYGKRISFTNHWEFVHTRRNRLAFNDISNVCLDSHDFGGIEAWGPGRDNLWEYNAVYDITKSIKWNGWANALFTDDACHYHTLRGNIVYAIYGGKATSSVMSKSCNEVVENNIFAASQIGQAFMLSPYFEPASDMIVRRNIVDGIKSPLHMYSHTSFKFNPRVGDATGEMQKFLKGKPVYKEVDKQIVWPEFPDRKKYEKVGWEKNALVADPLFVRRPPYHKLHYTDFKLKPESPALKAGFKQIPVEKIGLLKDFRFDRNSLMRLPAKEKLQAEEATRFFNVRPYGGTCATPAANNAWALFKNVDFGNGDLTHVEAKFLGAIKGTKVSLFIRKYKDEVVKASIMKHSGPPATIPVWEVSPVYYASGNSEKSLLKYAFSPEIKGKSVNWKPITRPTTDRAGKVSAHGVVNLNVFHGEDIKDGCAYMRTSIHTQKGRTNADLRLTTGSLAKVWLNGKLILNGTQKPKERILVTLNKGWNKILVKVVQNKKRDRSFHAKLGITTSGCGIVQALPGLPSTKREGLKVAPVLELRVGSPNGKLIGSFMPKSRLVKIKPLKGCHDLFLVFKQRCTLNYIRFLKTK